MVKNKKKKKKKNQKTVEKKREKHCSLLIHFDKKTPVNQIKEGLKQNDIHSKVNAMKKAIILLLNDENIYHQIFTTIVRYILPSEDLTIQKLLLLYLEIIQKTDSDNDDKVFPDVILICQNLRNNLSHQNDYIRGITLRFLCRLKEAEIIEPLIPFVLQNLEHFNPYVRKNALLALMSIYSLGLVVDFSKMIEKILELEEDLSVKRNAFFMLCKCDQVSAISYFITLENNVGGWYEMLQMVVLELIRKICNEKQDEKGKYITIIMTMLSSSSAVVRYEAASTLVSLSSSPTVIGAAAQAYCQLLRSQRDDIVRFAVLDRLNELNVWKELS